MEYPNRDCKLQKYSCGPLGLRLFTHIKPCLWQLLDLTWALSSKNLRVIMHLSMSCPTYPKSGQVGDMVGGWYQDFVPRGGDFVSPLYFELLLPAMQLLWMKFTCSLKSLTFLCKKWLPCVFSTVLYEVYNLLCTSAYFDTKPPTDPLL